MADPWYYTSQGNRVGPVTLEELRRAAASGQLKKTDQIWKEGMAAWVPAGNAKGLFPAVAAPTAAPSPQPVSGKTMFCPQCGQQNDENNYKCTRCGFVLQGAPQPQSVAVDHGVETLIPYKNAQALWSYYLGVFSLIPCLGAPLGVAALILGVRALKYSTLHPEAKGKAHAWVGIVLGSLCALGYGLLLVLSVFGMMFAK